MGFFVYSAELFKGCMGIHLCCRRACVTQQLPDTFYTCAIVEHRGRERVSQHVWREFFLCADERELCLHPMPNVQGCHSIAFRRYKQRVTLSTHLTIPESHIAATPRQVPLRMAPLAACRLFRLLSAGGCRNQCPHRQDQSTPTSVCPSRRRS